MIKILTTSYFDQTQAIGLVPIFEYYGIPAAIVYADVRETFAVIGRTKEFTVTGRQKEFNVIGRTKEFTVI